MSAMDYKDFEGIPFLKDSIKDNDNDNLYVSIDGIYLWLISNHKPTDKLQSLRKGNIRRELGSYIIVRTWSSTGGMCHT